MNETLVTLTNVFGVTILGCFAIGCIIVLVYAICCFVSWLKNQ